MSKEYDIVLFGVTGFTGTLAAEALLEKTALPDAPKEYASLKWAVSARNQAKAEAVLQKLVENFQHAKTPTVLPVDLNCTTPEEKEKLRAIVKSTKVVLTCSGPFELYGKTLVEICAQEGTHYADVTGETDFVRGNIVAHDAKARETGACIISHCGNDCIPTDLCIMEMAQFAKSNGFTLKDAQTYAEYGEGVGWSGGTLAKAAYQLGKDRKKADKTSFDPLLTTVDGSKSEYATKNASPKSAVKVTEIQKTAGPWVMGPVMVNCVKRSNALLGYSKDFGYGDSLVREDSWSATFKQLGAGATMVAAVYLPNALGKFFVPSPGQGPSREDMEKGGLTLYGIGTMTNADGTAEKKVYTEFKFNKDIGYLYTAHLLVQCGMLMLEKGSSLAGGILTPASALGGDLTKRITKEMDASFEIKELE